MPLIVKYTYIYRNIFSTSNGMSVGLAMGIL